MGLDYAYEMWVPQERLYSFLELVNDYVIKETSTCLYWPDGQTLEFFGTVFYYGDEPKNLAFDSSFGGSLDVCFLFEPNKYLAERGYFTEHEKGKCCYCGCIFIEVGLSIKDANWLDEEGGCVRVSFVAQSNELDFAFSESSLIRELFLEIARKGGAISCLLKPGYMLSKLLLLDGKIIEEETYLTHFRDLRRQLNPDQQISENQKKQAICQSQGELSHHDLMLRIDWAINSQDSGVRAAACKSLADTKKDELDSVICEIARTDKDWRVRYVAIHCLKEKESIVTENTVFEALYDTNYQVQAAAIDVLCNRKLNRDLANELELLVKNLPFLGPSMGAFFVAMTHLSWIGKAHHAQIIRKRINESDFPFEMEAEEAIERLESKI